MARRCEICGKGTMSGHNISHSHRVTGRRFQPNLQSMRAVLENGRAMRMRVCTRCIRAGKVRRPA